MYELKPFVGYGTNTSNCIRMRLSSYIFLKEIIFFLLAFMEVVQPRVSFTTKW